MTTKQLLIRFDYELFLGKRSGTVKSCMIEPREKLMVIIKKYGVKSVFFVDTTYLLRLQEQATTSKACKNDFQEVSSQLCDLVGDGHFVCPHIHPHWLDVKYLDFFDQHSYMHFISHPKMVTKNNLTIFDNFLGKVFDKYSIETDFHMMNPE